MNPIILNCLRSLELGKAVSHRNLTIVPLRQPADREPEYDLLADALVRDSVTVTEVNKGGSVPELKVSNHSDKAVLMLDGEELSGAKQNRVLNTTILLGAGMETVIPVSCTEHGRWSYLSEKFSSSGHFMSSKLRRKKNRSVTESLHACQSYASDQGEVWADVAKLHADAGTHSHTGAMKDAYDARQDDLRKYEEAFAGLDDSGHGFVVLIDGEIIGLDLFSRHAACRKLRSQLIRSYAMDALVSDRNRPGASTDTAAPHASDPESAARAFLESLPDASESEFPSVGLGTDYRYESERVIGSALAAEDTAVHAAFFPSDDPREDSPKPRMATLSHRRRYRSRPRPDGTDETGS